MTDNQIHKQMDRQTVNRKMTGSAILPLLQDTDLLYFRHCYNTITISTTKANNHYHVALRITWPVQTGQHINLQC